jgi:hypothetical protein
MMRDLLYALMLLRSGFTLAPDEWISNPMEEMP